MSDLILAINPARRVAGDAVVVWVRESHPAPEEGLILPARAAASAEGIPSPRRTVENLADLAPLPLPASVPAPINDPPPPFAAFPDYHYRQARRAYEAMAGPEQLPRKLLSVSI